MAKVKIKDRDESINKFHLALRLMELNIDYPTSELVFQIVGRINDLNLGEFTMRDALTMQIAHEEFWDTYFKKLKKDAGNSTH